MAIPSKIPQRQKDPITFNTGILYGGGNKDITAEQIRSAVGKMSSGEDVVAGMNKYNVSLNQLRSAMGDDPRFSSENINQWMKAKMAGGTQVVQPGATQQGRHFQQQPPEQGPSRDPGPIPTSSMVGGPQTQQRGFGVNQSLLGQTAQASNVAPVHQGTVFAPLLRAGERPEVTAGQVQQQQITGPRRVAAERAGLERAQIDPRTGTVQGQVADISSSGSPLMQRAEARGLAGANRRGLLDSSMGIQAGEAAVLDVATPIAQQDAAQYQQAMLANQAAANEQARFNAQQQLAAGQFDEQLGLQARQYQAQLATDVGQFNVGTAVDAAKFNTSNFSDLAKNYTQIAAGLGMQEQDLNARIGMQNAAEQNRVLGALMDIQQNRDLAMLDNDNKIEVAKINASVKGTADARAIYDNMAGRISDINQNANLTPEEADRQIQQQIALARDAINYSQHLDATGGDFNFGGTPSGGA